ncbi:MAG: Crp/Fnr family transcriptional regulator [Halothiobacillaceae bacterium]
MRSLSPAELSALAQGMREYTFERRSVVLHKDEPAQVLCFLLEGRLQAVDFTLDGREVGLFFIEPGDYFGELAVIDEQPQAEFVIALCRSRVAMLPLQAARRLMFALPAVAEQVALRLAARLRGVGRQRTILRLPSVVQRVCAQLLYMASQSADGAWRIVNAPTHQEIAIMIDVSRETVTRVFQMLQAEGVISRQGRDILVHRRRYLEDVAEGRSHSPKVG